MHMQGFERVILIRATPNPTHLKNFSYLVPLVPFFQHCYPPPSQIFFHQLSYKVDTLIGSVYIFCKATNIDPSCPESAEQPFF